MTSTKEVIAYAVAHLAGYVASVILSQVVLVPLMVQSGMIRSEVARFLAFFLLFVVVQVAVFFLFLAIRGRRSAPG